MDDWVLENLMTCDADAADLEDGGDHEADANDEEDVQLAEVGVPRALFADILRRIDDLQPRPPPLLA